MAVLLSAQCTDERVNQITPSLFARADNPKHMRNVPVDEVREIIRPCGLSPQKSKAIVRLAKSRWMSMAAWFRTWRPLSAFQASATKQRRW